MDEKKLKDFNIQLFGKDFPPFYYIEDVMKTIEHIAKIDEDINVLAIKREEYVKTLKEQIKNLDLTKVKAE